MKKKIDRKLNCPRYKFFAFLLISRKFIFLSFSLLAIISIVFQSVKSQLKGMVTAREEIAIFQLTLLGILVTSYVFLLNVVRKRESYDYARENTRIVIQLISCRVGITSAISIITAISMYSEKIVCKIAPVLFFVSIYIMLIKLLLIISIIAHQWVFFYMALKKLRNSHKEMFKVLKEESKDECKDKWKERKKSIKGSMKTSQPPMIKVFQRITELEQMVKQVYKSHAHELVDYFSQQDALEFIAEQKKIPESDLYLIDDYLKLLECRNNAIIINKKNKHDVSEIISIELLVKKVENTEELFLKYFFGNEYLNNLTFTEKNFNKADFNSTMFEGCIFNSVSLEGADCQNANFSGSKFSKAGENEKIFDGNTTLNNAKFDGVQFSALEYTSDTCVEIESATFRKANFYDSKLKNLKFKLAIFDGASFFNSKIIKVVFPRTSLNEVNFSEALIEGSDYRYALLNHTIFYRARLKNCYFCGAMLKFAKFNRAVLEDSKLINAVCDDASFSRAELKSTNLANASLNNTVFTDSKLQDVNMSFAIFENSLLSNIRIISESDRWNKFEKTEFNHTRFVSTSTEAKSTIQRSHFKNASFANAVLVGYTISDSRIEYSTFINTRFSDISFVYKPTQNEKGIMEELQFKECEFNRVKFFNIQMKNTTFLDCEFLTPEQIFFGVELNNVKFIGCSFPTNKTYRDFFKGTNVENLNKSEREKYVEILTAQKNELIDENDGRKQPTNETT